jgi:hypothetical protein
MHLFYWLSLIGPMALLVLAGAIRMNYKDKFLDYPVCEDMKPHPFLCHKKIPISKASIGDLLSVKGLSLKTARKIVKFYRENPNFGVLAVIEVPGVGKKTLEKLSAKFY